MAGTRETIENWFIDELKFKEINRRNGTVNCAYCALELHNRIVAGKVVSDKPVSTRDARIRMDVDYLEDTVTRVSSEDPRLTQPFSQSSDNALILYIDMENGREYYTEVNKDGTKDRVRFIVFDCENEGVDGLYKMLKAQTRNTEGVCFGLLSLSQQNSKELVMDKGLIVGHIINYYVSSGDEIFFLDAQAKTIKDKLEFTDYKPQISYIQAKHRPGLEPPQEIVVAKSEPSSVSLTAIPTEPASQAVAS